MRTQETMDDRLTPNFSEHALVPAIVQDAETGQVLMLAYMNAEALQRTLDTGQAHFWSRSRQELWHKGSTSGNIQNVTEIWLDCDGDSLLIKVQPAGPACHTGNPTCFYRQLAAEKEPGASDTGSSLRFSLSNLFTTICERRDHPTSGSYTARLLTQGEDEIVKKVGEEAVEIVLAAKGQGNQRLVEEIADLTYHILVLLAAKGLTPADVEEELARRQRE